MFERFTANARRVVVLAQEEARDLQHNYIGTEHLLLALLRLEAENGGQLTYQALSLHGLSLENALRAVREIVGMGTSSPSGHLPFTPRAKKVLELSLREALQLGCNYIGPQHILLGLIREGEGMAVQIWVKLGADSVQLRATMVKLIREQPDEDRRAEAQTATSLPPPVREQAHDADNMTLVLPKAAVKAGIAGSMNRVSQGQRGLLEEIKRQWDSLPDYEKI